MKNNHFFDRNSTVRTCIIKNIKISILSHAFFVSLESVLCCGSCCCCFCCTFLTCFSMCFLNTAISYGRGGSFELFRCFRKRKAAMRQDMMTINKSRMREAANPEADMHTLLFSVIILVSSVSFLNGEKVRSSTATT